MNTDDKFHPVNVIENALDYGRSYTIDDLRELIAAYRELEANEEAAEELQLRDERIAELEDELDEIKSALATFQRIALASSKERLGA